MDLLRVDSSDSAQTLHEQTVLRIIKELGYRLASLAVYNKIDVWLQVGAVQATAFQVLPSLPIIQSC